VKNAGEKSTLTLKSWKLLS